MATQWRVLLPERIDPAGPADIADIATCSDVRADGDVERALEDVADYDAIIVRTAELDADVVARADRLKVISKHGAGLDVFDAEPPGAVDPLCAREDVLLTPHVGGVTDAAMEQMSRRAAANVRTVYEGNLPDSTVNRDALEGEPAR